jgi:antitoxin (DNA-binding transcriptional repressor) of toxin-antitoxin stability system
MGARKATVRDLHLKTSDIVKQVANGETFLIEKKGVPVAELRPVPAHRPTRRLPNREAFIRSLPFVAKDSGRILEEDRS